MITNISVGKLYAHPNNPRKDYGDISELSASIKANGILQNLTVVPIVPWVNQHTGVSSDNQDNTMYTVVIGHRRLAAAKIAGLTEVPCTIAEMDEKTQVATMLLENIQRSDLTVWEQAQGFQLMLDLGETVGGISQKTGFSDSTVRRRVKLLELDSDKFKSSVDRGATLQDYMELDQITDINLKNKVLDSIGTNNFRYELNNAIDKEKWYKRKAEVIAELETFAAKVENSDGMRQVGWFSNYSVSDNFEKPDDAEDGKYYYIVNEYNIQLLKKESISETVSSTNDDDAARKRMERKEQLAEINKRAYELRFEFFKNYSGSRKHSKSIMEFVTRLLFEDWETDMKMFNALLEKEYDEEAEEMRFDDIAELYAISPERILLLIAYCFKGDSRNDQYYDYWGKYYYNKKLESLYTFLEKVGYTISDEERALRDGTHELFLCDEKASDKPEDPCAICKSARPYCDKCCASCDDKCNSGQLCRKRMNGGDVEWQE